MVVSNVFGGRFVAVPEWSLRYIATHGQARDLQVLTTLASMMNTHNKTVDASITQITERVNASKETVKRSIKWLADNGLVTIVSRPKPHNNQYIIHFEQRSIGSPMTLYGVTHDPINGSPMTLLTGGDRVTSDPIKTSETPMGIEESQIPRDNYVLEIIKEVKEKVASDDGKVVDMILGSDPDDIKVEKEQKSKPEKRKPRPEVNDLATHFVYHPRSVMACSYSLQDMNILRRSIRLLLDGGLTRTTVRQMIDKFFSNDKFASADSPVLMFSSKSVQETLMNSVEVSLDDNTNPIMMFMLNDFTRGTLELPWGNSDDEMLKETVMMRGMDICYRYPELMVDIIKKFVGDFENPWFLTTIDSLNSLVRWHITDEESDHFTDWMNVMHSEIELPSELRSNKKTKLRQASDNIASAIYTYRRLTRIR
jgi:hypothetical protein